jgi:hypothetical protein
MQLTAVHGKNNLLVCGRLPRIPCVTLLPKTPPGGNPFPPTVSRDDRMSTRSIATTVTAKLPEREGEFTFSKAAVTKAPDGRFVVELTDDGGHVVPVAYKGSDLKSLIGWRLLMGL